MSAARVVQRQSLIRLHPIHCLLIVAAVVWCAYLLYRGLTMPILYTEKLMFWESTYSVWTGVRSLWHEGEQLLAVVVFFFSMVFPIVKLISLIGICFVRVPDALRLRALHWLGLLGKWSMLDVFVVAILIVLVKLGPVIAIKPRPGVYYFAAAILCSMVTTVYVEWLARRDIRTAGTKR